MGLSSLGPLFFPLRNFDNKVLYVNRMARRPFACMYRRLDYGAREETSFEAKGFDEVLAGVGRRGNVFGDGWRRIGGGRAEREGIGAARASRVCAR